MARPQRISCGGRVGAHLVLFGAWTIPRIVPALIADPAFTLAVLVTGVTNGVYFIALRHAYRHAPAGAVYPLARSAPLLVALGETLLFGRALPAEAWLGVALSVIGLWLIAFDMRPHGIGIRRALPFAALAALMTGVYSLSDKVAALRLERIEDAIGFVSVTFCIAWLVLTLELRAREGRWWPAARPDAVRVLAGGLTVGVAYALVIHSMRALPAAYAVTLANGGVLLMVLLGMLWLGEREGWQRRLAGAGASAVGMAIVALVAHKAV